jgi:hypothetical protein
MSQQLAAAKASASLLHSFKWSWQWVFLRRHYTPNDTDK